MIWICIGVGLLLVGLGAGIACLVIYVQFAKGMHW